MCPGLTFCITPTLENSADRATRRAGLPSQCANVELACILANPFAIDAPIWWTSESATFPLRAIDSELNALPDQLPLELCDRAEYGEDHLADGCRCIDRLRNRNEIHTPTSKVIQRTNEMLNGTGKAIKAPHQDRIESFPFCVRHEPIELRPAFLGSAPSAVCVFIDDRRLSLFGPGPQRLQLRLDVLAVLFGGDSSVDGEAHLLPPQRPRRALLKQSATCRRWDFTQALYLSNDQLASAIRADVVNSTLHYNVWRLRRTTQCTTRQWTPLWSIVGFFHIGCHGSIFLPRLLLISSILSAKYSISSNRSIASR